MIRRDWSSCSRNSRRGRASPLRRRGRGGGSWIWWNAWGHHAVLSNPKQTKAIAAAGLKNDRGDAERLALLLRGDLLPTVWSPPARLREARELVRHRTSLVWVRAEIKYRVVALLWARH